MITPQQLANGLRGTRRLLSFDITAWTYFEKTADAFWASFVVAVVMLPLDIAHVLLQYFSKAAKVTTGPVMGVVPYMIVELLSYVLSWTLFPFIMMYLVRLLQRPSRYFWYMVPYNWLQLPVLAFIYALSLLTDVHILPIQAANTLEWLGVGAFFIYGTFIAAYGLQIGIGTALSLAVLDFVVSEIVNQLITRI